MDVESPKGTGTQQSDYQMALLYQALYSLIPVSG